MALKGSFSWYNSLHQGGRKAISFTLVCDNLFQSETFDCAIVDGTGQLPPQIRRQVKLKSKQSFRFDYDSCGWEWCQGDYFAILGKNDKIEKRWNLNLKVYAPGECPDCHGTHRCLKCNGTGVMRDGSTHTISSCTACYGTGICQRCYVPIRQASRMAAAVYGGTQIPNADASRQRKIAALRKTISELQANLERAEWEEREMKRRCMDLHSNTVYSNQLQLKHFYERQLIHAQYELSQLESMDSI